MRWSRTILAWCMALMATTVDAQLLRKALPGRSLAMQYAGSVGSWSIAAMRHTRNERIGAGFSYGRTPPSQGGPLNTWALRFMYTPWQVDLNARWRLEPVQTGVFIGYTTGLNLGASWPSYLEKGYYWWTPNFRQHLYLRSQLSYRAGAGFIQRIGGYFEVNANDLYVYSWWPNRGSISVYDILFFGAGVQVYFKPYEVRRKSGVSSMHPQGERP